MAATGSRALALPSRRSPAQHSRRSSVYSRRVDTKPPRPRQQRAAPRRRQQQQHRERLALGGQGRRRASRRGDARGSARVAMSGADREQRHRDAVHPQAASSVDAGREQAPRSSNGRRGAAHAPRRQSRSRSWRPAPAPRAPQPRWPTQPGAPASAALLSLAHDAVDENPRRRVPRRSWPRRPGGDQPEEREHAPMPGGRGDGHRRRRAAAGRCRAPRAGAHMQGRPDSR